MKVFLNKNNTLALSTDQTELVQVLNIFIMPWIHFLQSLTICIHFALVTILENVNLKQALKKVKNIRMEAFSPRDDWGQPKMNH